MDAISEVSEKMDIYTNKGSGWVFINLNIVEFKSIVYQLLKCNLYIDLSSAFKKKKAIINVKNTNNGYFKYYNHLNTLSSQDYLDRAKQYEKHLDKLNWNGLKFFIELKRIKKFEKNNPNITVNVFNYKNGVIYLLRLTTKNETKYMINLVLIIVLTKKSNKSNMHYC